MQPSQLLKTNKVRSDEIARRAITAIGEMQASGERISFYSVAKRAQVARSTLYRRADLRELVEGARANKGFSLPDATDACSRVAELEEELAYVRRERDEIREAISEMRTVNYYVASLESAA